MRIWLDFNLLGFKISLLWICKDTAYSSWLVSGNWQMNNAWRLYLCLSINWWKSLNLLSPSLLTPIRFPPHFPLQGCQQPAWADWSWWPFTSSVYWASLHHPALSLPSAPCPGNTLLSQLRRHGTHLAVVPLSGTFLFALQVPLLTSECFIPSDGSLFLLYSLPQRFPSDLCLSV